MKGFKVIRNYNGGIIERDIDILNFVYDQEVVRNNIESRCQILQGELEYNTILGISLKATKDIIDLDISRIINETNGVNTILLFDSSLINRKYSAIINVETIYNNSVEVKL